MRRRLEAVPLVSSLRACDGAAQGAADAGIYSGRHRPRRRPGRRRHHNIFTSCRLLDGSGADPAHAVSLAVQLGLAVGVTGVGVGDYLAACSPRRLLTDPSKARAAQASNDQTVVFLTVVKGARQASLERVMVPRTAAPAVQAPVAPAPPATSGVGVDGHPGVACFVASAAAVVNLRGCGGIAVARVMRPRR